MGTFTYTVTEQGVLKCDNCFIQVATKHDFDVHVPACKRPDSYRIQRKPVVIQSKVEKKPVQEHVLSDAEMEIYTR